MVAVRGDHDRQQKGNIEVPFNCTVTAWEVLA